MEKLKELQKVLQNTPTHRILLFILFFNDVLCTFLVCSLLPDSTNLNSPAAWIKLK